MGWKKFIFMVLALALLVTQDIWSGWFDEFLIEIAKEENEAEALNDNDETTITPPTPAPIPTSTSTVTSDNNQHPSSFFFLCERLGKDKHVDEEFFGNMYKFYNDKSACYIAGRANEYRGNRNKGSSGRRCEKWNIIVDYLQAQIDLFQNEKNKMSDEEKWTKLTKSKSNIDTFIEMTNKTITEMRNKDILHHNYCRDPDDTGVPWCYVKVDEDVAWEPCDVPKCTTCWGMRQNAETPYGRQNNYWSPFCHITEGFFLPLQCHGDYCWCSEKNGSIVNGTAQHREVQGMPICDPVMRAQMTDWEPGETEDGQDANQVFADALMASQIESYKALIHIASTIFDEKKTPTKKKSQKNEKLS